MMILVQVYIAPYRKYFALHFDQPQMNGIKVGVLLQIISGKIRSIAQ
jgi:hypothetical protein